MTVMTSYPETLAIIPARGGSKGIKRKNIKDLAGFPLIYYSIAAALNARLVSRVVVSTDDDEIAKISSDLGAEVIRRPDELAQDDTPTLPVLNHVVQTLLDQGGYKPNLILTLQPTSPLRTSTHIDDAIEMITRNSEADSLVSVVEVPHVFHPTSVMKKNGLGYLVPYSDEASIFRRQDKSQIFARNGAAIYLTRIEKLDEFIFGGKLLPFAMDEESSIDIDAMNDFLRAEAIMLKRNQNA